MLASAITILLIIAGALVGLFVLTLAAAMLMASRYSKAIDASMVEDVKEPARAWVQVAIGLINFRDPAYSGDIACKASLKRDWSIESRESLLQRADKLAQMIPASPAWHGVRLMNMLRIAEGAGFLTAAESWQRATTVAQSVRPHFAGWDELAAAMHAALDEQKGEWVTKAREELSRNLSALRRADWRGVAYL